MILAVPSTCANVLCSKNTVCKMVNSVGCRYGNSPCKQYPVCLPHSEFSSIAYKYFPNYRTCDAVKCKAGQKCVLREVICITTPWLVTSYPQAICENSCPPNEQWRTCPTRCELTCKEQQRNSAPIRRRVQMLNALLQMFVLWLLLTIAEKIAPSIPDVSHQVISGMGDCIDNICTRGYCSADETCEMQEILCIIAPCWPIPTCIPSTNKCLKPNEMYRQCPTKCERSCTNSNISCRPICKPACQCKDKWYRDPSGNCVQNCSTAAREG
uniref:TIL domain-containing protein n=1 Tax=Heterorhabditis bacteriophora TaxID=37862 RepID=A0A1I7WQ77_HETBA